MKADSRLSHASRQNARNASPRRPYSGGGLGANLCSITAPIIIIGSGRSGTSLLNAVLGGHPDIMMLGEMRFMVPRVWDALWGCDGNSVQRGLRERFLADVAFGLPTAEVSDSYKRIGAELKASELERTAGILRRAIDDWFCISSSSKRHWGFKEIWNGGPVDIDWAIYDRVFPEATWVHIVRHPLSFANSCAQLSGRPLDRPYLLDLLLNWKKTIEKSRERRSSGRYFEIRYEDLCAQPDEVLRPLFLAIDLLWDDHCAEGLRRQHGPKSTSADGSEMRGVAQEIGLSGLMQELGYTDLSQVPSTAARGSSSNGVGQYDIRPTARSAAPNPRLARIGAAGWRLVPPFPRESGNAWEFTLPPDCGFDFAACADNVDQWTRSPLELFEDGRPLGRAHALHEHIRVFGAGAYSHWRERLLFSSSDNSDPNVNGRGYSISLLSDALGAPMGDAPAASKKRSPAEIQQAFEYADLLLPAYFSAFQKSGASIEGLSFLEIGPGPEFGVQLILASMGAKITLADPYLAQWDPDFHPVLYQMLSEKWPDASRELKKAVAGQSHEATSLVLVREPAEALNSVPDESMDFVYSNAVLEHVVDMRRVAHELARVSKVGAWSAHQIDWRDHRDFSRPLEHLILRDEDFLRAAEAANWKFEFGNRLRSIEFRALFEEAGFEVIDRETNMLAEKDYMADVLPRIRASYPASYADWPEEDLVRISGRFYVRKLPGEQVQRVRSNADDMFSLVNAIKSPAPNKPGQVDRPDEDAPKPRGDRPVEMRRKGLFTRIFKL